MDGVSEHDLANYDIGCDEGDTTAFMRKMWCGAQAMPFALAKWFVGIGINIMDWALEFEVAETLTPVAGVLSRIYESSLIGPVNLVHLAWLVTLFVGGWSLMSGRTARGVREIFTTFLIAILGGIILANPEGYLEGAQDLARNSSGMVLEAVDGAMTDDGFADASEVRNRLSGILQRAFVDEPYDLINWGEPLRGECAQARNEILSEGPHGSDDRPREIMRQHGCDAQAEFNATPSDNRAVGSLTVTLAAVLITLLLISLALAVFTAQITLVILFSAASLVWIVALFPGGRGLLWMWISRLVWAVLITVTAMFLLSWVAITTTVLLDNTSDISIIQRSVIVIVLAAVAYKFRGTIDRGLEGAGAKMAAMMGGAASGGGAAAPDPPARGASGMALSPVAVGAAVGLAGLQGVRRARQGGQQATRAAGSAARVGAQASEATDRGLRTVGSRTADAGRSVIMAPVLLPQRIGQRQAERQQRGSTRSPRSAQARERLDRARQTRRQWRQNAAHPLRATRQARTDAERSRGDDSYDWM